MQIGAKLARQRKIHYMSVLFFSFCFFCKASLVPLFSSWLSVFTPCPPHGKSAGLSMVDGRDMFLVSDSCSMLNHVKPQLCALVLVCQEAYSAVGACLVRRFHALSEQTCKQLRFPSEVVPGDFFFFPAFLRGKRENDRISEIVRQAGR